MSHLQALPQGTELVSDFKIERVLGAGGFGITYLAREMALDRQVTIKEYFPGDFAMRGRRGKAVPRSEDCEADYQWGLDRFIEEAQTLAKFDHLNIVRVYRYFRANNTGYMVLHFEEGKSLKTWLQEVGRKPRQTELDRIIAPLLDALAVVHAADFLHRDIAPDNIIIRNDGSPVLIDFGAARGDIAQHSRTVSALVKPGYSPYEQYGEIGHQQGPWTDIYALAATLYHAITGKRPPDAPSRVVKDELIPSRDAALSAYRPSFLKAIDQGLMIDIERRPRSVAEWRGALLTQEEQRGWFGTKRVAKTIVLDDGYDQAAGAATTKALTVPIQNNVAEGRVPPPPDAPGRRGRIVDFLDGVRKSPRATSLANEAEAALAEPMPAPVPAAEPEAEPEPAVAAQAVAKWSPVASAKLISNDRPVEVRTAPNVLPKPKPKKKKGQAVAKRKPPKPRPVRTKSRIRWFPLVAKLAVGVVVATFLVRLQASLPQIKFGGTGTVSSAPAPVAVKQPKEDRTARSKPAARAKPVKQSAANAASPEKFWRAGTSPVTTSAVATNQRLRRSPVTLLMRTINAHLGGAAGVGFANQGATLVTVGGDGMLKVWDSKSYKLLRTLELENGPATALAVSGNHAFTGHENGRIGLWDITLGMQLRSFKRNDAAITSIVVAGPDKFLAGSHDWSVTLWETATPSVPLHVFEGHGRDVLAVAYEPVRGLIASASADRTVRMWQVKSLSHLRTYPRNKRFITAVAFSPDGDTVLIGTLSGDISLYSTSNRRRKRRFRGHGGRITSLQFIGGGREFVSASADGTVRLWDSRDSRPHQTFGSAGAKIASAVVSPNGRLIAAAKDNGTIQIWNAAVLD